MKWKPISSAPFDCDLKLAVHNHHGIHALAFPCSGMSASLRGRAAVQLPSARKENGNNRVDEGSMPAPAHSPSRTRYLRRLMALTVRQEPMKWLRH